jgi:hypothetical protein
LDLRINARACGQEPAEIPWLPLLHRPRSAAGQQTGPVDVGAADGLAVPTGRTFPTNRRLVNGLADLWCSVSVLDAWRASSAQLARAYMGFDPEIGIDLYQWQQQLTVGPHRSQACWRAYLGGHFSDLLDLVMDSRLPTQGIVW